MRTSAKFIDDRGCFVWPAEIPRMFGVLTWIRPEASAGSWWMQFVALVAATSIGIIIALLGAKLLRMPELSWLLGDRLGSRREGTPG